MTPATRAPAMPTRMVCPIDMGSGPGRARGARPPRISPSITRAMRKPIMGPTVPTGPEAHAKTSDGPLSQPGHVRGHHFQPFRVPAGEQGRPHRPLDRPPDERTLQRLGIPVAGVRGEGALARL